MLSQHPQGSCPLACPWQNLLTCNIRKINLVGLYRIKSNTDKPFCRHTQKVTILSLTDNRIDHQMIIYNSLHVFHVICIHIHTHIYLSISAGTHRIYCVHMSPSLDERTHDVHAVSSICGMHKGRATPLHINILCSNGTRR